MVVGSASGLGFDLAATLGDLAEGAMEGLGGWRMAAWPRALRAEKRVSRPLQPGSSVGTFSACRFCSGTRNSSCCAWLIS